MDLTAGKVVAGRYRLERPLASGGMGKLWVARHLQLDVDIALKFISDDAYDDRLARARFEREARAAARLQSPYVVRAYDYGVEDRTPFLAMELLQGESLDARLARVGRLPPSEVASLLDQLAEGLEAAHELGIVHRDLKPSNIFITRAGRDGVAKILDFGIAKETNAPVGDDRTATGTLLGSPRHMSPEQARGGSVDARSDLWSLAVVIFQALTRERPFDGDNFGAVLASILVDPIPQPSARVPELGTAVDRFFEKAFARNPDLRFQSAAEMARAFRGAIRGEASSPVSIPPSDSTVAPVVARTEATHSLAIAAEGIEAPQPTLRGQPARADRSGLKTIGVALAIGAAAAVAVWSRARPGGTSEAPATTTSASVEAEPAASGAASAATAVVTPDVAVAEEPPPAVQASVPESSSAPPARRPRSGRPSREPGGSGPSTPPTAATARAARPHDPFFD